MYLLESITAVSGSPVWRTCIKASNYWKRDRETQTPVTVCLLHKSNLTVLAWVSLWSLKVVFLRFYGKVLLKRTCFVVFNTSECPKRVYTVSFSDFSRTSGAGGNVTPI